MKINELNDSAALAELAAHRKAIDGIDKTLLELLSNRFGHAVKIAEIKAQAGVALYDPEREAQIIRQLATSLGDHESLTEIVAVYEALLQLSKKAQAKHLENLNADKKDLL